MKTGQRDYRDFLEDMTRYAEKGMRIVEDSITMHFRAMRRRY
jgi:hypothetical protein